MSTTLNGRHAPSSILGPSGQPYAHQSPPSPDLQSRGFYGVERYRGIVTEEYLPALSGTRKVDTYIRMRATDGLIEGITLSLMLPVIAASWSVEPAGGDANAKRAAELVEDNLFNTLGDCWEDEVRKALSYLQFGWQLLAMQWAIEGGEARVTELRDLHPRTIVQGGKNWDIDERGHVVGVWQYGPKGETWGEEYVPATAFMHFVHNRQFGDPEGRAIYRSAYPHWYFKQNLYKYEAIGMERSAVGTPVGSYPNGASDTQQDNFYAFLKGLVSHEEAAAIFPKTAEGEKFEIDNASVDLKASEIQEAIKHHDTKITQCVLAQFLNLGQDGRGGAYALSSDQTDLFLLGLEAVGDYVAARFSRRLVQPLVSYNIATDQYPKLAATISRTSAAALANMVRGITAGISPLITPDEALEDHLRERLQLPPRIGPRPKPQPPVLPGPEPKQPGEGPPKPGEELGRRRERIELNVLASPWGREPPTYLALGTIAEQFQAALVEESEALRAEVGRIARLPLPGADSAFTGAQTTVFKKFAPLTPEQEQDLDAAISFFMQKLMGEGLTEADFAGTATEDSLIADYERLAHATGVEQSRRLSGQAASSFAPTRESPEIQALLRGAFGRLTKNSEKRLFPYLDDIKATLVQAALDGESPFDTAKALGTRFDGFARHEWERLARTEASFAANQGQIDELRAEGVKWVEPVISALACPVCQAFVGSKVRVTEAVPGENLPPYHPHCLDSCAGIME